jgi:hypothetical protein
MLNDAQSIIAATFVVCSIAYLAWRTRNHWRGRQTSGCGSSCHGCASSAPDAPLVVQITVTPPARNASS